MFKKNYFAPKMEIVCYKHQTALLDGSGNGANSDDEPCDAEYCGELGFNVNNATNPKV